MSRFLNVFYIIAIFIICNGIYFRDFELGIGGFALLLMIFLQDSRFWKKEVKE